MLFDKFRILKLSFFIFFNFFNLKTFSEPIYLSKLTLRTSAGNLNNSGSLGGSTTSIGGFNLVATYFITNKLTVGIGYRTHVDLVKNRLPVWGFDFSGRYYFSGNGSLEKITNTWGSFSSHNTWAFYIGGDYSQREYFLGEDPLGSSITDQLRGDFATANFTTGLDYRLSEKFELNLEFLYSVLAFAGSDDRVVLKSLLISSGITYLF